MWPNVKTIAKRAEGIVEGMKRGSDIQQFLAQGGAGGAIDTRPMTASRHGNFLPAHLAHVTSGR